jgi:hypothetical protein
MHQESGLFSLAAFIENLHDIFVFVVKYPAYFGKWQGSIYPEILKGTG